MSALVHYRKPVPTINSIFDDIFSDSFFSRSDRELSQTNWPNVDIVEHEQDYTITAELAGLDKKDVKITVEDGVLSISGEKAAEKESKKENRYHYFERSYGKFERKFQLPENINDSKISAKFKNGLLTLTLAKEEKAKPKAIEISLN